MKLKIAILGSGNIGADLLVKSMRSEYLEPAVFVGRRLISQGMLKAQELGVLRSDEGIDFLANNPELYDLVFDATSAKDHIGHAEVFKKLGKTVIDMTPSSIGGMCIPSVNLEESLHLHNVNMVTCGGQAAIPIVYAISQVEKEIDYIEVVSSIASKSAGPGTRANLDEYVHTTERAVKKFSGAKRAKAILNLNPAIPCVNMQTTIFVKAVNLSIEPLVKQIAEMVDKVKKYVPGYEVLVGPVLDNGRIVVTLRVTGLGDYLPEYAGNLDIINCAAIDMAEKYAGKC